MAKSQKRVITALALVMLALLSVCAFSACGSKDYTVTFMIEDKSEVVSVVDGKVTLPEDPTKDGYIFRGWYTDESFSTAFDANAEITEDMTVYAYFVPITVNVHVNGEDKGELNVVDYETFTKSYQDDALSKNLSFDGWYIDAGYTTPYTTQDVDDLYGRYLAEIVFDNGYEVVLSYKVEPGTVIEEPELSEIHKYYMSIDDIYYVYTNADGSVKTYYDEILGSSEMLEVDFEDTTTPVKATENTTFKVIWKTPYIKYAISATTGNAYVSGFSSLSDEAYSSYPTYPVLSFPRKITYKANPSDTSDPGELKYVDVIQGFNYVSLMESLDTVIFQYGIKEIYQVSCTNTPLKEIEIPGSVKLISDSFHSMEFLEKVTIHEGVEGIYNSFWKTTTQEYTHFQRVPGVEAYDFDIAMPDSLINLSLMPSNLTFSANSCFSNDGNGRIYKTDGSKKILVVDMNVVDGVLTVEDGVTHLQVGVFSEYGSRYGLKQLILPASLVGMEYNLNQADYPFDMMGNSTYLLREEYIESPKKQMRTSAYSVVDDMNLMDWVIFKGTQMPEGFDDYAFINGNIVAYSDPSISAKLVFTGTVAAGESIDVYVTGINTQTGEILYYLIDSKVSGDTISAAEIRTLLGISDEYYLPVYTQLGETYSFGSALNKHQYIVVEYNYTSAGYTYTENNGEITITGYKGDDGDGVWETGEAIPDGTGKYIVNIPASINGKPVVAIGDNAFKDVTVISTVYIPASIKTIGAYAFSGTSNLTTVDITPGGLEVIKTYAFADSGFTSIALPLKNITNIEPYAFKSANLKNFLAVEGEETRTIAPYLPDTLMGLDCWEEAVIGQYYFVGSNYASSTYNGIVKYTGKTENVTVPGGADGDKVTVLDVQYVATAGGNTDKVDLGMSARNTSSSFFSSYMDMSVIVRYEVMEGSFYYKTKGNIRFFYVSKIHANAFTDMGANYLSTEMNKKGTALKYNYFNVYVPKDDAVYPEAWLDPAKIRDMTSEIFEAGWWEGWTAEANADDEAYKNLITKMSASNDCNFGY